MDKLKKEGLKYIEEGLENIERYRKDGEIEIAFNIYHEVNGAIDMLHTVNLIDWDEASLLRNKTLDLICPENNLSL